MNNIAPPNDESFFLRLFHIPYILQVIKLIRCGPSQKPTYPSPRFQLFQPIPKAKDGGKPKQGLLWKLIKTFKKDIIICFLITFLWTGLNLLVPRIIKEFFSLMKLQTLEQAEITKATFITQQFVILQIFRSFVSGHLTRACYELSLKVESTLSSELTGKSLRINSECRSKLPESEVYHLQNVDIQHIGKMFKHIWMILDIPLTLFVAIFLLFMESATFGFVGLYWIVIMFFLQRWLSDQLGQCIRAKNGLMEQRAKFNYETMEQIQEARLDHSENILLQKNNDFFLKENKVHHLFYHYQSLFEISLLLLPIIVAISISLYDSNEQVPFTIKQVYMLLTLLGICYKPLKNIKSMSLHTEEGLHSLNRVSIYFQLPQINISEMISIKNQHQKEPSVRIKKDTMTMQRRLFDEKIVTTAGFYSDRDLTIQKGERLVVLGKKGQGTTAFLQSLLGELYVIHGSIKIEGSLAYLPQLNFFCIENIRQNIAFYDQSVPQDRIKQSYIQLGLEKDLKFTKGLDQMVESSKFSESQLKKIGLARVVCSNQQVYLLDCPYMGLGTMAVQNLQKILRQKEKSGCIIIMVQNFLRFADVNDKVIILSGGQIKEYGAYGDMISKKDSLVHSFKLAQNLALSDRISYLPIVKEFQQKIKKILILHTLKEGQTKRKDNKVLNKILTGVGRYSLKLKNDYFIKKKALKKEQKAKNFVAYFTYFWNQLPYSQWLFSIIIILSIQLLHVFIQYQIGQQYKKAGMASLGQFKTLMLYQLALTCGLAFLMYIQFHVLGLFSTIIGNKVYEKAITAINKKQMKWYTQTHAPFIAGKLNHDYEQIYTVIHNIFDILKYIIVCITTLMLIQASFSIIVVITTIVFIYYYLMLHFFRKAEQSLIRSFPIYKQNFVKVFDQIVQGGLMINVFGKTKQAYNKAKRGFISNSSYKQGINSTKLVQDMVTELTSCFIIALALEYGTIIKIKQGEQNEALVAVSVLLLFNLSDVFKNLMQTMLKLQSFFRLKLIAYVELINIDKVKQEKKEKQVPLTLLRYNVEFSQILLTQKDDPIFQIYPLSLSIYQGEKIVLYEQDNTLRNNILMALTNNLQNLNMRKFDTDVIKIGGVNLDKITKEQMQKQMTVILPDNFYFTGTLQQNLRWMNPIYDQKQALKLAKRLNLKKQLPHIQKLGMNAHIEYDQSQRQLSRKLALIKAILKKSKIIIAKDTPWYFGGVSITDIIEQSKMSCTVIGITNDLAGCECAQRLVYLDKLKIIQDDKMQNLQKDGLSLGGALLRSVTTQAEYLEAKGSANLDQVLRASIPRTLAKFFKKQSRESSQTMSNK